MLIRLPATRRLSATVRPPSTRWPSGTVATPQARTASGVRPRSSRPLARIDPAVACRTPAIASTRLDLPAPFGPSNAVTSPRGTVSETSRTTSRPPRATVTSWISSAVTRAPPSPSKHAPRPGRRGRRRSARAAMSRPKSRTASSLQTVWTRSMSWSTSTTTVPSASASRWISGTRVRASASASPAPGSSSRTSRGVPTRARAISTSRRSSIDSRRPGRSGLSRPTASRTRSTSEAGAPRFSTASRTLSRALSDQDDLLGLEGPAQAAPGAAVWAEPIQGLSVEPQAPGGRPDEAAQHVQHGRLARTVRPDEAADPGRERSA